MSVPKPNIFDFFQEDEFLNQTREKPPHRTHLDQRSYSSTSGQIPKIEFKESIMVTEKLIKKPTFEDEKLLEKSKLKTIFETSCETIENRTKSHTESLELKKIPSFKNSIENSLKMQESFTSHRKIPKFHETRPFFIEEKFEDLSEFDSEHPVFPFSPKEQQLLESNLDYPPNKTFFCEGFPEIKENLFMDFEHDEKIACFVISQQNLAFASTNSIITIFDLKTKVKRKLKLDKEKDPPTAIDITYDEEILVIGFSNGILNFYEILTMKLLKSFNKFHSTRILAAKFYHNIGRSGKESKLLVSDSAQNVNKIVFEKGIFGYDADFQLLIRDWGQFFRIEILNNISGFWEKTRLAALASIKQIAILSLEPKTYRLMSFYRPEHILERTIPSISWNEGIALFDDKLEDLIEEKPGNINEKGEFITEMEKNGLLENKPLDSIEKIPENINIIEANSMKNLSPPKTKDLKNESFSMKNISPSPINGSMKTGSSKILSSEKEVLNPNNSQSGVPSTLLAILWGSVVFIIRIYSGKEKNAYRTKVEKCQQLNFQGFLCFFLNEKLLLILENCDENLEKGQIVNIETFPNYQQTENIRTSFFVNNFAMPINEESLETQAFTLKIPINFQTALKDSQNMLLPLKILNFSRIPQQNRVIYCHDASKILELGVFPSNEFFSILSKRENLDFSEAIFNFLSIYQGKTSFLRDNPENQPLLIETLIQGFTRDFLPNKDLAFSLIYLLIMTRNFRFLFEEVLGYFQLNSREEEFFLILETFILRKNVDFIPEKSLRTVISYYWKKNRVSLVHELVFALDYIRVDVCPIITLCLEFHLLKGLIYVSTVFAEDFITPLIKIFSLYETIQHLDGECAQEIAKDKQKSRSWEENVNKNNNSNEISKIDKIEECKNQGNIDKNEKNRGNLGINEKNQGINDKNQVIYEKNQINSGKNQGYNEKNQVNYEKNQVFYEKNQINTEKTKGNNNEKKTIDFGGQCLKFLSLCFRKKLINNTEIPDDKYAIVLQQLIIWVFEPENLRKLHGIDPQIFFEVIFLLFSQENVPFLLKFRPEDLKIVTEITWLQEIEAQNQDFKTQNHLLIAILYLKAKEDFWLSLFIGKIVNLKRFYLPTNDCLKAMRVLLENPELLEYFLDQDWANKEVSANYDRDEIRKSEFLIEILNYVQGKVEENQLEAILAMPEVSL